MQKRVRISPLPPLDGYLMTTILENYRAHQRVYRDNPYLGSSFDDYLKANAALLERALRGEYSAKGLTATERYLRRYRRRGWRANRDRG